MTRNYARRGQTTKEEGKKICSVQISKFLKSNVFMLWNDQRKNNN